MYDLPKGKYDVTMDRKKNVDDSMKTAVMSVKIDVKIPREIPGVRALGTNETNDGMYLACTLRVSFKRYEYTNRGLNIFKTVDGTRHTGTYLGLVTRLQPMSSASEGGNSSNFFFIFRPKNKRWFKSLA